MVKGQIARIRTWMLAKWCSRIRSSWLPLQAIVPVVEQLQALQQHAFLVADMAIRVATKVSNHIKSMKCQRHVSKLNPNAYKTWGHYSFSSLSVSFSFSFLPGEWMAKLHAKYFDKNVPSVLDPSYLSHLKIASHAQRDHWNARTNKFMLAYSRSSPLHRR